MTKSEKIVSFITPLYFKACREAKSMLFNDLMNHHESRKLIQYHLRVDKAGSSFVYFTFEANEGLAFYSTLNESIDENHRDLIVYCAPELQENLKGVMEHLKKKVSLEILSETVIEDRA